VQNLKWHFYYFIKHYHKIAKAIEFELERGEEMEKEKEKRERERERE
jgi:hypothetical protein